MITIKSTPEEVEQVKVAFKQELKQLLEKYNASFSVDHEGDMHNVDCFAFISLHVQGSFREINAVSKKYSSYLSASDII